MKYYKKEREAQALVDGWNKLHGIGEAVVVRRADGSEFETVTKGKARLSEMGEAVVFVKDDNRLGCYLLERVKLLKESV